MRSFAIWYDAAKSGAADVTASVHVNFWSQTPYKNHQDLYFLDFGIMVSDISKLYKINLYVPFEICKFDVKDLGGKISDSKLINAIFNEDYTVISGISKHCIVRSKDNSNNSFVVYALNESTEINIENCRRSKCRPDNPDNNKDLLGTIIILDIKNLPENKAAVLQDLMKYYFRIRVQVNKEKFSSIRKELKNTNHLNNAFEGLELVDFRINDIRSCCEEVRERIAVGGKFKFEAMHFLAMREMNDSLIVEGDHYTCRLLEQDIWNNYIDNLEDNMLAYHFKVKCTRKDDNTVKYIDNMSLLLKFRYKRFKIKLTLIYIGITIVIGTFINIIYELLRVYFMPGFIQMIESILK